MSQFFYIHPENPQARLINQAVEILRQGGVIVYPTDSGYALGCMIGDKHAMDRIVAIRKLPEGHNFTLVCSDLSELSTANNHRQTPTTKFPVQRALWAWRIRHGSCIVSA